MSGRLLNRGRSQRRQPGGCAGLLALLAPGLEVGADAGLRRMDRAQVVTPKQRAGGVARQGADGFPTVVGRLAEQDGGVLELQLPRDVEQRDLDYEHPAACPTPIALVFINI